MKDLKEYRKPLATAIFMACMTGSGSAFAFGSIARDVVQVCQGAGNPLKAEFGDIATDCNDCHDNGSGGGSGAGKSAYRNGNFDFFCPPVTPPPQTCTDADGDGFSAEGGMCGPRDMNDNNADVYPGAPELCNDGVDNDGNGLVDKADPNAINCAAQCTDMDGDSYSIEGGSCGPVDCNDNDASINPGAEESCSDGIDNNCNGKVDAADPNATGCPIMCTDRDGDGYSIEGGVCGAVDCNDSDPALNPGAMEICGDGIDNNCDARIDGADSTCRAMDHDDDLKDRHDKARHEFEGCKAGREQDSKDHEDGRMDREHGRKDSHSHSDRKKRKHKHGHKRKHRHEHKRHHEHDDD